MPPLSHLLNLLKPYHSLQLKTAFPKIQLVQLYEYLYVLNSYLNQIQQLPFFVRGCNGNNTGKGAAANIFRIDSSALLLLVLFCR